MASGSSAKDTPQIQAPSKSRRLLKNPFSKSLKPFTELNSHGAQIDNPLTPPPRPRGHAGMAGRTLRSSNPGKVGLQDYVLRNRLTQKLSKTRDLRILPQTNPNL